MTSTFILLLFIQCCCVSGQLLLRYNFSPLADLALKVSVDEVNRQSSNFNLHRPDNRVVRQVFQTCASFCVLLNSKEDILKNVCNQADRATIDYHIGGKYNLRITLVRDNTYDVLLDFGIKETVCQKYTRRTYMDSCLFKRGRFASKELCSSLVRVGSMSVAPLGISCIGDTAALGSSSESSSEEVIIRGTGRAPLGSFSPGVILCQGELDCSRLLL